MVSSCAERNNGLMRFTISRTGKLRYYLSKFFEVVSSICLELNGLSSSLEKEFNNYWSIDFINELSKISNYISNLYDATPIFNQPLNTLLNKIKESSKITFTKIFNEINKTIEDLNELKKDTDDSKEQTQKELINNSKSNFNSEVSKFK